MKKLALVLLVAFYAVLPARASIVCVAPTSTTAGSVQVTSPVAFSITTAATAFAFDMIGWVTSDGSRTFGSLSPNLAYSLNGTAGSLPAYLTDNASSTSGNIGLNDGYFVFSPSGVAVAAGNALTLLASTYTIAPHERFQPASHADVHRQHVRDRYQRRQDQQHRVGRP